MPSRRSPDPFAVQIGERIHQLRIERNLSLVEFSQMSGISRGHLSEIERGKVVIRIGTLGKLAEAFELPVFMLGLVPENAADVVLLREIIAVAGGDTRQAAATLQALLAELRQQEAAHQEVLNE